MTDSSSKQVDALLLGSRHHSEKRCAFRLKVRTTKLQEYIKAHDSVWEPMLEALSRQGWRNYSLFLDPATGDVFGYFESDDCSESMKNMSSEEADEQWQSRMSPFFETPDGGTPQILSQYFYLA